SAVRRRSGCGPTVLRKPDTFAPTTALPSPFGGESFTSCGNASAPKLSSLWVAPFNSVTSRIESIAPLSGSLWTPTMTAVVGGDASAGCCIEGGGEKAPKRIATSHPWPFARSTHAGKGREKSLRRNELGETNGFLPPAVQEEHDRQTRGRPIFLPDSRHDRVIVVRCIHVKRHISLPLRPYARVSEGFLLELFAR